MQHPPRTIKLRFIQAFRSFSKLSAYSEITVTSVVDFVGLLICILYIERRKLQRYADSMFAQATRDYKLSVIDSTDSEKIILAESSVPAMSIAHATELTDAPVISITSAE